MPLSHVVLSRPARHDGRSRTPPPPAPASPPDPQPWFPWTAHPHNPRPNPAAPDPNLTHWQLIGGAPVPWATQCRDCWGFIDDPRHLG